MKNFQTLGRKILKKGYKHDNRTGMWTRSLMGEQLKFNLQDGFPILTTKRVPFEVVAAELFWFLSGSTDRRRIQYHRGLDTFSGESDIWKANAIDAYERSDSRLFDGYNIGHMYGKWWRRRQTNNKQLTQVKIPHVENPWEFDPKVDISKVNPSLIEYLKSDEIPELLRLPNLSQEMASKFIAAVQDAPNYHNWIRDELDWKLDFGTYYEEWNEIKLTNVWNIVTPQKIQFVRANAVFTKPPKQLWKFRGIYEHPCNVINNRPLTDADMIHIHDVEPGHIFRPQQYIDQIQRIIDQLKNDPNSRRVVLDSWNPDHEVDAALATCHPFAQFFVRDGELTCIVYQRSADYFLGLPFNIASYALLTHLLAWHCDLRVGQLIFNLGDVHIYDNHVDQVRTLCSREPKPLPKLKILRGDLGDMYDLKTSDVSLLGYMPHPTISANMVV